MRDGEHDTQKKNLPRTKNQGLVLSKECLLFAVGSNLFHYKPTLKNTQGERELRVTREGLNATIRLLSRGNRPSRTPRA